MIVDEVESDSCLRSVKAARRRLLLVSNSAAAPSPATAVPVTAFLRPTLCAFTQNVHLLRLQLANHGYISLTAARDLHLLRDRPAGSSYLARFNRSHRFRPGAVPCSAFPAGVGTSLLPPPLEASPSDGRTS